MQRINVQFYNARGDAEGVVNRVVSYFDPPYCHCEVEFQDAVACAIYWGGTVHMRNRTFNSANYDCIELKCPHHDYERALGVARAKSAEAERFNLRQMLGAKIPVLRGDPTGTFCSKLCVEVLQAANLLPKDVLGAETTPSALFQRLSAAHGAAAEDGTSVALDFVSAV
jgi:hypothetical protein